VVTLAKRERIQNTNEDPHCDRELVLVGPSGRIYTVKTRHKYRMNVTFSVECPIQWWAYGFCVIARSQHNIFEPAYTNTHTLHTHIQTNKHTNTHTPHTHIQTHKHAHIYTTHHTHIQDTHHTHIKTNKNTHSHSTPTHQTHKNTPQTYKQTHKHTHKTHIQNKQTHKHTPHTYKHTNTHHTHTTHIQTHKNIHTHTNTKNTHTHRSTTVLVDTLSVYIFVLQALFAVILYYFLCDWKYLVVEFHVNKTICLINDIINIIIIIIVMTKITWFIYPLNWIYLPPISLDYRQSPCPSCQ